MSDDNIIYHLTLSKTAVDAITNLLVESAAEQGHESDSILLQYERLIKAQVHQQNGQINTFARCSCADCRKLVKVPVELLGNVWTDTSAEFFCPFCDAKCGKPRCVECRLRHADRHVINPERTDATATDQDRASAPDGGGLSAVPSTAIPKVSSKR